MDGEEAFERYENFARYIEIKKEEEKEEEEEEEKKKKRVSSDRGESISVAVPAYRGPTGMPCETFRRHRCSPRTYSCHYGPWSRSVSST